MLLKSFHKIYNPCKAFLTFPLQPSSSVPNTCPVCCGVCEVDRWQIPLMPVVVCRQGVDAVDYCLMQLFAVVGLVQLWGSKLTCTRSCSCRCHYFKSIICRLNCSCYWLKTEFSLAVAFVLQYQLYLLVVTSLIPIICSCSCNCWLRLMPAQLQF